MNVIETVNKSSMKPYQWLIVVLCMFCNMLDGFVFFAMGFVLPHLPDGFATSSQKGFLISAGLVGMATGAVLVAPLADRYRRRPLILAGLGINIASMVLTASAANVTVMLTGRILTGIGVGTLSATIVVVAQEYSSASRRNLAIGIVTVGFPLGSTLAGLTGVSLIGSFGGAWQAMFWVGAAVSLIGLVLIGFLLPESLSFLSSSRSPGAAGRIAGITRRLGIEPAEGGLPGADAVDTTNCAVTASASIPARRRRSSVLGPVLRERTLLLWVGYGFLTAAYYFVGSWTPQLIADARGSAQEGAVAGTIISVGSLAGSILFGLIGLRLLATRIAWTALGVAVISLIVFSLTMGSGMALIVASILGLAVFVAVSSYTAMAPAMYPSEVRARGYGLMVGISRIGAVVTPILAGYATAVFAPETIFLAAAVPLAISAVAALRLWAMTRREFARELAVAPDHNGTAAAAVARVRS